MTLQKNKKKKEYKYIDCRSEEALGNIFEKDRLTILWINKSDTNSELETFVYLWNVYL